jgi:hypothetical protein
MMPNIRLQMPTYLPTPLGSVLTPELDKLRLLIKLDPVAQLVEQRTFNP